MVAATRGRSDTDATIHRGDCRRRLDSLCDAVCRFGPSDDTALWTRLSRAMEMRRVAEITGTTIACRTLSTTIRSAAFAVSEYPTPKHHKTQQIRVWQ